jgi:hypothetical protein
MMVSMGAATSIATRFVGGGLLRADERALVLAAGSVFALASGGAAMAAAASDALFLAEIGPAHLGTAVAVSSALLAVVLAVVGGLSDRLERRRVLASLSFVSALVLVGLAALTLAAPRAAAITTLIGGKQLAAATDLAFWVVIAERIDARRSQRLLPLLAATGGAGAAVGAVLVVPIASAAGAQGVLVAAALLLACAGLSASRLGATRRVAAPAAPVAALIARSWRDGARAVRRHPLANHLAVVVAAAGVFGSLAYFALGVEVAARGGSTGQLAALLGGIRGGGQVLTLVVQLLVAPRVLGRLGTGRALLLAPFVALAAGLGLVVAPILAVAIATQVSARVLDASIETPAEKLAQTLLPTLVRGRVAGFLDGTAKRAGAVLGGVIAAVLAGDPTVFYAVTAIAAALWLLAASRIARELPALAIEHVAADANDRAGLDGAVVDDRAIDALVRELDGPRPERAADVLARLHDAGRTDAVAPLVRAAVATGMPAVWRSLIAVLDTPSEVHGPALLEAAQAATMRTRELAIRALGLAGGVEAGALEQWRDRPGIHPTVVFTADVARMRLAGAHDALISDLGTAAREPTLARAAIDELASEVARSLARADTDRALEAARQLTRTLRRGRGDAASRTTGLGALTRIVEWARDRRSAELALLRSDVLELVRERVEQGASTPAPDTALVSLLNKPAVPTASDDAAEVAAALRLYGDLLSGADAVDPEDLRRVARALGEPDDDVRTAAEQALAALGPAAAGELIATAAWGRRRARDRAAALLADLPVTPATIDRLVDAELDALEQTAAAIAILVEPGDELLARRLDERLREIAHTVLLLVAARRRSRAIARAAVAWRHARAGQERARTLAVIEAALPRALVGRLVEAVDDLTPADRAAALRRAGTVPPQRDAVMRAELAGRDRLSRALVLHTLGAAGRSAHRDAIAQAAQAEAAAASATDLLRRLTEAVDDTVDEGAHDMPSRVETLIALGRVPLLASLSTRQLADVAERARWVTARDGSVLISAGDPLDALIVVEDGELQLGDRRIGKGEVVDELACVAPAATRSDLSVVRSSRLIRLERVDFEELVDDVPGLASAVCRALGERARRAEDAGYRSPLASRSS